MTARNILLQAVKRVWIGPFSIGPLVQPVSLGSALLKIFDVIWKGGIVLASCGLVLATVLATGVVIQKIQSETTVQFKDKLKVWASYDLSGCPKGQPLSIAIQNDSDRTLYAASISMMIAERDRSTNLITEGSDLGWDLIVKPGETGGLCYQMPKGVTGGYANLDYRPTVTWAIPQ